MARLIWWVSAAAGAVVAMTACTVAAYSLEIVLWTWGQDGATEWQWEAVRWAVRCAPSTGYLAIGTLTVMAIYGRETDARKVHRHRGNGRDWKD